MADLTEKDSSRFLETKRWRFHYNEVGDGHPVVLLHGSGPGATGWSNFQTNLEPLGQDFRAIAIDMPGWGKTESSSPDDRDHVEALSAFLDELGVARAAVIGNSMGGLTALRFAVEHSDRISHLIPMGAPGPGTSMFAPGGMSEGLKILFATYADPTTDNFKKLVSVMAYDQKFATDELAAQRSENALANPAHLKDFLASMATRSADAGATLSRLGVQLAQIDTPTLVVHGRDDRTVHFENGLRLVATIPNSRLLLLNRCGHWAQLEHASEFNRAVKSFITAY